MLKHNLALTWCKTAILWIACITGLRGEEETRTSVNHMGRWLSLAKSTVWEFLPDGSLLYERDGKISKGRWRRIGTRVMIGGEAKTGQFEPKKWFEIISIDDETMTLMMLGERRYTWQLLAPGVAQREYVKVIGGSSRPLDREGSRATVRVSCDRPEFVHGLTLRVNYLDDKLKIVRTLVSSSRFDRSGKCQVELPPGFYQFEALGNANDVVVAFRSVAQAIAGDANVEVETSEPQPLALRGIDGRNIPLLEIGIRSGSAEGEVKWKSRDGARTQVSVALSPNLRYRVRVIARSGSTSYAVWDAISTSKQHVVVGEPDLTKCRFRWDSGSPDASRGKVTVEFPDSVVTLDVKPETELLLNRRFVTVSYEMETVRGKRISFHKRGYTLAMRRKNTTLPLCGRIRPTASGHVVRIRAGRKRIRTFIELQDAHGHVVNLANSQVGLISTLQWRDGRAVKSAELEGPTGSLHPLLVKLDAKLDYNVDGVPKTEVLRLAEFTPRQSEHCRSKAPKTWDWRLECYLAKAERIHHAIRQVTGRGRRKSLKIDWHGSRVPLGGGFGISMPIRGLVGSFDFYHLPKPIIHEMLHAFGYAHGENMKQANGRVFGRLMTYRWCLADNPALVP